MFFLKYFSIKKISLSYYLLLLASTPDWVAEFAEKQAQREAEDRIKVS